MASLAEIRAKLQEEATRRSGVSLKKKSSDNTVYPFWDIPNGSSVNLRFLSDKDQDNTFFWVEKQVMKFPFRGVAGGDENKEVIVQVPCVEMWGDTCPVHVELRPFFKQNNKQLEDLARVYWKKKTYILQGFVRNNPIKEDENPIRRFQMTPQVFNIVKAILLDPEVNSLPTDYDNGIDFTLTKTKKGEWSDYTTSKYSRNTSALLQEERDAIAKYGLFNLADYLPKRPSAEEVNAIYEMFQASFDGQLYDPTKWGKFYKPRGIEVEQASSQVAQASVVNTVQQDAQPAAPVSTVVPSAASASTSQPTEKKSTQDILSLIRKKNENQQ